MRRVFLGLALGIGTLLLAAPTLAGHGGHGGYHGHGGYYGGHYGWGGSYMGLWWGPWMASRAWVETPRPPAGSPNLGVVDTDVEPERALVYLDGDLIGTADDFDGFPDYLYLRPGHYTIEFKLGGYATQKAEIDIKGSEYHSIDFEMQRVKGAKIAPWYEQPEGLPRGRVYGPKKDGVREPVPAQPDPSLRPETTDRDDEAEDDTEDEAEDQAEDQAEEIKPDRHKVEVERHEVESKPPAGAAFDLRITPGNASVYLDGELMGTAEELGRLERGLAVTPGKHRIDVLAPGYVAKVLEIAVRPGQHQQVVVELATGAGQGAPQGLE